ncbi:hypothetical protein PsAD2_02961 [Pseudovibrio axinellae]|uniref:Uncharacterized protein n=1 Tax=Pseudovibrio axinellae TaxID=989403 RepID=A0A165XEA2_9HYPH|nr:hypothetical protein [Pseudovibrio axinellae]KZL17625.1 hypothetical protein PsAD2_02961 [Pseudovibrio axinellae]SER45851.1 hypothetical protein SAMN05421798_110121 [Pseudovibrio axinellae]
MTDMSLLLDRLNKVQGIGSMLDYQVSLLELRAVLGHIRDQKDLIKILLEALENLENDDRQQMPPSAWQLVQEAIKAAGGASKPFTTPSADWRENGEEDPHGKRYDCKRHETTGGHLSDDQVANMQFMCSNDLESATIAKDRIRWLSRKVVAHEAELEQLKSDLQDKHKVLSNIHMGDIAPGLTEEDVASLFPELIEKACSELCEKICHLIEGKARTKERVGDSMHSNGRGIAGTWLLAAADEFRALKKEVQSLKGEA